MSKTLILVIPPQRGLIEGFSTGLISLGNYIRLYDDSIELKFLDLGLVAPSKTPELVSEALLASKGRVFVGITGTTASYQSMLRTARQFKGLEPACIVVFGGHHVTPQDDVVLKKHPGVVDVIIRGEGERALLELVKSYPNISAVPNVSVLRNGEVVRTAEAARLPTEILDRLQPTLDHQGLRCAPGKFDHVTYVSARGCPLACSFCVVRSTAVHAKSVP